MCSSDLVVILPEAPETVEMGEIVNLETADMEEMGATVGLVLEMVVMVEMLDENFDFVWGNSFYAII